MNQDTSPQNMDASDSLRAKIRQMYSFLKEANQLQFKPVRKLADHPHVIRLTDIPKHPSDQIFMPIKIQELQEIPDILIRVSRPKLTKCPNPPATIREVAITSRSPSERSTGRKGPSRSQPLRWGEVGSFPMPMRHGSEIRKRSRMQTSSDSFTNYYE